LVESNEPIAITLAVRVFLHFLPRLNAERPESIALKGFRLDVATKIGLEADKKRDMSEPQASLSRFPLQVQFLWEPLEEGRHPAVAFLGLLFGGRRGARQRK
jgi:hypothetical protein